jgi:DNA modification methylase
MKTVLVNISDLKDIPQFKEFYADQPVDDLVESYQIDKQLTPIHISENNEIINGYRFVAAIRKAGGTTVEAIVKEGVPTLYDRILLNQYRKKTTEDEIKEIKAVFKKFPKRQGVKNPDGTKYVRDEIISSSLNNRWKGDKIIQKLEYVIDNDLDADVLLKGIVGNNWKVETSYDFLKDNQKIDHQNNYGFTQKIIKGEISVADANKLIQKKYWLDNEFKYSFKIPEKANSYNLNCVDISKMDEHKNSVDLLFTSPPYFILRKYENDDPNQLGHEDTKEEYCTNVAKILNELIPTLKETANVIINIGETYDDGIGYGIPQLLKESIEKNTSLIYKDTLVWSKPNPKPVNENIKRPINNVEYLLWFVVNPKKAKYNMLTFPVKGKGTKISHGTKDVDSNGIVYGKHITLSNHYGKIYSHLTEQEVANIIEASIGKNNEVYKIYEEGHPAIMSGVLPVIPILMTTDELDTVFDPFSGSNVVGRMSCLLNRVILSSELSNDYFKIGCRMIENSILDFNRIDLDYINSVVYKDFNKFSLIAA